MSDPITAAERLNHITQMHRLRHPEPEWECMECSVLDCPEAEPLHYDKDGCPVCAFEQRRPPRVLVTEDYERHTQAHIELSDDIAAQGRPPCTLVSDDHERHVQLQLWLWLLDDDPAT